MAKASDLMGAGPFIKRKGAVTLNNEIVPLYDAPALLDGEMIVFEAYGGGGSDNHKDHFIMALSRKYNTIHYKIIEGAITLSNATDSTGFLISTELGVSLGDAAPPTIDVQDKPLLIPGSGNWIVPAGITSVCVVCIGGGGGGNINSGGANNVGGGGAGLAWKNNIAVTPGQSIPYSVGATGDYSVDGGDSTILGVTATGGGGTTDGILGVGGIYTGADGGGNGGNAPVDTGRPGGGAGAGGYTGNGGDGVKGNLAYSALHQGSGGGASGGRGGNSSENSFRGGGVNLYGEGANGDQLLGDFTGENGSFDFLNGHDQGYGAGGPATADTSVGHGDPERGGAIRIIWGAGRSFPNNAAILVAQPEHIFSPSLIISGENESGGNDVNTIRLYTRELISQG